MFFVLSKVLSFLTAPHNWFYALFIYILLVKDNKRKNKLIKWAFVFFMFFSNGFIYNEVRRIYEPNEVAIENVQKTYDYGIVLTGMTYLSRETDDAHFAGGGDRILQAVNLYGQGKLKKILITGGSSRIFDVQYREATFLKNFLLNLGIPENDVIAESDARNTYENALFTAQLLDSVSYNNLLLITSAKHMPRSVACFKKQNLVFDVFPTDPTRSREDYDLRTFLLPNVVVFGNWASLFHEWIGLLVYKIKGYA
ncbi:MAG: YdcF family protein [Bacteroidia bacterium]